MTHHTTSRHSARHRHCMAILLLCFTGSAWAAPDILVSPSGTSIVDIEFDTAGHSARYVYCQPSSGPNGPGTLYRGVVKLPDGVLGAKISVGTCAFVGNGPEWGQDYTGTFVAYLDYDAYGQNGPIDLNDLTVKYIRPPNNGGTSWTAPAQVDEPPNLAPPNNVVYASQHDDSVGRVVFMAASGSSAKLTTHDIDPATNDTPCNNMVPTGQTGNFPHFSPNDDSLLFTKVWSVNNKRELFKEDMSNCTIMQLTFDGGVGKTTPTSWFDPYYNKVVYGVLMSDNNNAATKYRVYDANGQQLIEVSVDPAGLAIGSPETFQTNDASYLLYVSLTGVGDWSVFVANLSDGTTKRMSDSTQAMQRVEPEVGFLPDGTPRIYFSATDPLTGTPNAIYRTGETTLP